MGLISTAAFILATQNAPSNGDMEATPAQKVKGGASGKKPGESKATTKFVVPQDRISEIWDHIDNRLVTQTDLWFELGEFPTCVSMLRIQNANSPDDEDVMSSLGWMLENIEQVSDAREIYLAYLNAHPNDGNAAFSLGNSYSLAKDWDNAIKYLEPSLSKNPGPNTYRVLGKVYERNKMYKDAIRVWELELKRFPGEPAAIANIKRVKARYGLG